MARDNFSSPHVSDEATVTNTGGRHGLDASSNFLDPNLASHRSCKGNIFKTMCHNVALSWSAGVEVCMLCPCVSLEQVTCFLDSGPHFVDPNSDSSGSGAYPVAVHDPMLVPVHGMDGLSPVAVAQNLARDQLARGKTPAWMPPGAESQND